MFDGLAAKGRHGALDLDARELLEIERYEAALDEELAEYVELLDVLETQQVDDVGGGEAYVAHGDERVVEGDEVLDELEHVLARLLHLRVEEVKGGVYVGVEGLEVLDRLLVLEHGEEERRAIGEYGGARVLAAHHVEERLERGQEAAHEHVQVGDLELRCCCCCRLAATAGADLHDDLEQSVDFFLQKYTKSDYL